MTDAEDLMVGDLADSQEELYQQCRTLAEQNALLLAALERIVSTHQRGDGACLDLELVRIAEAALSLHRATGGQP